MEKLLQIAKIQHGEFLIKFSQREIQVHVHIQTAQHILADKVCHLYIHRLTSRNRDVIFMHTAFRLNGEETAVIFQIMKKFCVSLCNVGFHHSVFHCHIVSDREQRRENDMLHRMVGIIGIGCLYHQYMLRKGFGKDFLIQCIHAVAGVVPCVDNIRSIAVKGFMLFLL